MPSINSTHNMDGVRNTTSTDSPEKTSTGKSYGKSLKLFGSQLKKNTRDAVKGFDAEKLRSKFEKFCATTGPQAKQCASDLCKQAESHLRKGCKEAHKQWKKAKPHLEKAMHSVQKNFVRAGNNLQKKWEETKPMRTALKEKIADKANQWAETGPYKRHKAEEEDDPNAYLAFHGKPIDHKQKRD